ncbi:MAG: fused response regulator/phosphatase [Bdellovibrionales bacterium]
MPSLTSELSQQILASPILIVDDIKINRVFLEKTLNTCGFHNLLCVASAEEALAKIKDFKPDLVLLDILMPKGMDGYECCEALRKQEEYRDLPILIETSIVEPELRIKAFKIGATDFVSKPIDSDELCARVIVHLEKRHSLKTLQLYKSRIETELESAKQLQLGILPEPNRIEEYERNSGLTIAAAFESAPEIGGGFWGIHHLSPHQIALWLVDFSGHGMPAALKAFRMHAYLKENIPEATRPGDYLSKINDMLLNLLPRGQFFTMFYGIIDTKSCQLFFSRAYMKNSIVLHRATGKVDKLDGSAPPLGLGMHQYLTQTMPFTSDDVLLIYSDALIETPDAAGNSLTEAQVIELIENNSSAPVDKLKELLLGRFKDHASGAMCEDLIIVVCSQTKK